MDPITIAALIQAAVAAGGYALDKFGGKKGYEQVPTVSPQVQGLIDQLTEGLSGQEGGLQSALQYYMDILSNNPEAFARLEAPAMRQFNEQIVPGIAERFSSVGGQRSSAFPQALSQAGAGLAEQLAAQRAGLQGQAAAGLQGLFGLATTPTFALQTPSPSFLQGLAPGIGQGLGQSIGALASRDRGTNPAAPAASGTTPVGSYPIGGQNPYSYGIGYGNTPYAASGLMPRY